MTTTPVDVVGIGAVSWDRFLVVPRFPKPDSKVRAIHTEECGGGMVGTALAALSRWGLRCRLLAVLGQDHYSERILADLGDEGVDVSATLRLANADGRRSTVLVDNRNGQRSIVSGPHRIPTLQPKDLPPDLLTGARVLHLDTTAGPAGVAAAQRARESGLLVTLDADRVTEHAQEMMLHADYIVAPYESAREMTGQRNADRAAYALHLQTSRPCIVTHGSHGCYYADSETAFHEPSVPVPVVDSTGAGDVFLAGLIYGLLAASDIHRTLKVASWAAARVCTELGGRKGIPSANAMVEFGRS